MKIRLRITGLLYGVCAVISALCVSTKAANAQAQMQIVPGQVMIYCMPATPMTEVQALAAKISAVNIIANKMPDVYQLILPADSQTVAAANAGIATLKGDPHLKWVGGNRIYHAYVNSITPNDPRYPEMHPLPQVNMPQAWALQKGVTGVNIADIDSGIDAMHEDLLGRYDIADSFNWGDNNSNAQAGIEDHGVSTSGIMIANTNNGIGVSGICWQNVLCVGEKIQSESGTAGAFTLAAILSAYADINTKYKTAHIVSVNMSYGGPGDPTNPADPEVAALQQLQTDGLILVAAAGNSSDDDSQDSPAGIKFVITVSACNRGGQLTYYSSFGKVDLAAPGGEQFSDTDPNGYLVCKLGSGYAFEQGTSFACPTVCAIATLLMCVPGVTQTRAEQILFSTANHSGLGALPDPKFGWGIVDAYNALVQVSASTAILAPDGIDPTTGASSTGGSTIPAPVSTLKPTITFNAYNIPPASEILTIDPASTDVSFTGAQLLNTAVTPLANVSDVTVTGTTSGANPQYTISFRYSFPVGSTGSHTVQISGTNPGNGQVITDSRVFSLAPHVFTVDSSGVSMISIPYFESQEDLNTAAAAQRPPLFTNTDILYRWLNVPMLKPGTSVSVLQGTYAIYGSDFKPGDQGNANPNVALTPTFDVPTPDVPNATPLNPIGAAYFLKNPAPITLNTYGSLQPTTAFSLPLHQGWNMIGDPYNFQVDFNSMEFQQTSGARITIQAASDAGLILPHVYHYSGGDYTFDSLPNGTLNPWEGQWIYVVPSGSTLSTGNAGYLIVTPAAVAGSARAASALGSPIQNAVASAQRSSGPGGWTVQLQASTGSLHDNNNFIGESTRATMGMDATKVPKPPKLGSNVTVGITHAGLNFGGLAQDLQPIGAARTWNVSVTTDQTKAQVTLGWPNINTAPRNYRLVLTDVVSGQTVDMRSDSSFTFNSGAANTTRAFTITATPTAGRSRAMVTNITVNPAGRAGTRSASAAQIGYTVSTDSKVDVTILGLNGRVIAQVSPSRAVTSGQNTVQWSGQDVNGHIVPAGSYILQIRAVGPGGDMTRQIVPFTVTGR